MNMSATQFEDLVWVQRDRYLNDDDYYTQVVMPEIYGQEDWIE